MAASIADSTKWDAKTVPFDLGDLPEEGRSAFMSAVGNVMRETCVKFQVRSPEDKYWIKVEHSGTGCYSYVGLIRSDEDGLPPKNGQIVMLSPSCWKPGQSFRLPSRCCSYVGLIRNDGDGLPPKNGQIVMLSPSCWKPGVIEHELMHVLGFFHEHSRYDRDEYINIVWENIDSGKEGQFRLRGKDEVDLQDLPYDYESVMHYRAQAFSANGQATIRTVDPKYQGVIGQRGGMSKIDSARVNLWYNCPHKTEPLPHCEDAYPSQCPLLAAAGDCEERPGFMNLHCRLSCDRCRDSAPCKDTRNPDLFREFCAAKLLRVAQSPQEERVCLWWESLSPGLCVLVEGPELCRHPVTAGWARQFCPRTCALCPTQ